MQAHTTRDLVGFASLVIATAAVPAARAATLTRDCNDGLVGGLTIAVAGLAVFDIATAPGSARRYNAQHFTITPQLDPVRRSYGVSVSWNLGRRLHPPPPQKSPGRAFAYSLVSTAAPMALGSAIENEAGAIAVLSGVVLGPSVGHFYAGQEERALITLALRGAGTTLGLAALVGCLDFSTW